jgi:hypothetical protein
VQKGIRAAVAQETYIVSPDQRYERPIRSDLGAVPRGSPAYFRRCSYAPPIGPTPVFAFPYNGRSVTVML